MTAAADQTSMSSTLQRTASTAAPFTSSEQLLVAEISPTATGPASHIEARVALVWPYSNSTGTFALLLVDTSSRSQVKVVFRDGCAKAVAHTKVGIGDHVKLALLGCEWKETQDLISTPGKRVDWDLLYRSRLVLQVRPQGLDSAVIDYTASATETSGAANFSTSISSNNLTPIRSHDSAYRLPTTIQVPYLTPKYTKGSPGITFVDALGDATSEDDGYVSGRGRKRTKFARQSGAWSLVDTDDHELPIVPSSEAAEERDFTPGSKHADDLVDNNSPPATPAIEDQALQVASSTHDLAQSAARVDLDQLQGSLKSPTQPQTDRHEAPFTPGARVETLTDSVVSPEMKEPDVPSSARAAGAAPSQTAPMVSMGPPLTPLRPLQAPQAADAGIDDRYDGDVDRATTPRILPLASPGLPLVSPLIQRSGVEIGYFPPFQERISPLDATGRKDSESSDGFVAVLSSDTSADESVDSGGSLVIIEEHVSEIASASASDAGQPTQKDEAGHQDSPPNDERSPSADRIGHDERIVIEDPPLLPEQWLASLEASIAHELSQNDLTSPILIDAQPISPEIQHEANDIEIVPEPTAFDQNIHGLGIESDDLYGAPDEVPEHDKQVDVQNLGRTNHRTHASFQSSQVAVDVPDTLQLMEQERPSPVDVMDQFLRSPSTIDGTALECATTTSQMVSPVLQQDHDANTQRYTLDGNVDLREAHYKATNIEKSPSNNGLERDSRPDRTTRMTAFTDTEFGAKTMEIQKQSPLQSAFAGTHQDKALNDNAQLLTPDQTQMEAHSMGSAFKTVKSHDQISPPSPEVSQKIETVELVPQQEKSQREDLPSELDTPAAKHDSGATAPQRSSQRVSSRSVAKSKNVSSTYFTPRRSARFSISPSRKENIPLPASDRDAGSSSPTQAVEELELNEYRRTPLSSSPVLTSTEHVVGQKTGLHTPLAYYAHLSSLCDHFGQILDVIAICSSPSTKADRAKSGPKDYHTSLHLIDPTSAASKTPIILAQVFRPLKKALPVATAGDVVILRNFKVHTVKRNFALLSTDSSAWAILKFAPRSSDAKVVSSGPPIEHGSEEATYALSLSHWWTEEGIISFDHGADEEPDTEDRAVSHSSPGPTTRSMVRGKTPTERASWVSPISSPTNGRRRMTTSNELKDVGDEATEEKESQITRRRTISPISTRKPQPAIRRRQTNLTDNMSNEVDQEQALEDSDAEMSPPAPTPTTAPTNKRRESTISTAPSTTTTTQAPGKEFNPRRSTRRRRSPSLVHELRDGTKYVDDEQGQRGSSVVHELRDGATYVDD